MASDTQLTPYGGFSVSLIGSRLADLCLADGVQTGPFGSQLHQEDYVEDGTPIITVEHLGENRILHQNLPRVSEEDRLRLAKYSLRTGDIVFSRVGSVDRRAIVREAENGWLFSGRCLRVRPDPEKLDPLWLSYFFGLPTFKQYIRGIAVGATMPSINTKILSDVSIYFPELSQQRYIATLLASLDDKIDLNRRINQTLEAMAQAIFKSWFVDFDPVKAKIAAKQEGRDPLRAAMSAISGKPDAELDALLPEQFEQIAATAALFPDEMEESELGDIPRGWEFKRIGDYLQTISKTFPLKTTEEVIFLNTGDIQNGEFLHQSKSKVATLPGQAKKSIQIDDILYSEIRPENKRFAYVHFNADEYVVSTKLMVLRSKGAIDPKFLYFILGQQSTIDRLQVLAESRSGTFPQITFDVLSTVEFLAPKDCKVANHFAETVVSQVMKITNSKIAENSKLANLRDTLLPKLLSGELSVEALTEQAGIA